MKKKVLFLVNHDVVIYNFRKEIVSNLIEQGYEVIISSPYGKRIEKLIDMGCTYEEVQIDRHGTNPLEDFKLILYYRKLMKKIEPNVILTFTIKPNIYGAMVAKWLGIPCVSNITGLGNAIENRGMMQKITTLLYKYSFSKIDKVFFQNQANMDFFQGKRIALNRHQLLPGSGVNLTEYQKKEYPPESPINFIFVSRIMQEKGIDEFLYASNKIVSKYDNVYFHICGFSEDGYEQYMEELPVEGKIIYHGMMEDLSDIYGIAHCIVHPSHHEGMSNVLLEASASGVAVIASKIPGCQETFDEGRTGYGFEVKNKESLISAIENFIELPYNKKREMGFAARKKMEKEFDRQIVVNEYMNTIKNIVGEI